MTKTNDGRPAKKCGDLCLSGSATSDCECVCARACHGRGECNPELHRYDRNGIGRIVAR